MLSNNEQLSMAGVKYMEGERSDGHGGYMGMTKDFAYYKVCFFTQKITEALDFYKRNDMFNFTLVII